MPLWAIRVGSIGLAAVYFVALLWLTGDLSRVPMAAWSFDLADAWATLWLKPRGVFYFEAIAVAQAGPWMLLLSPLNLAIAALLAVLVGANIHGAGMLYRQPAQCSVRGANVGILAALPALLAGGACCAPALLLVIGLPSLGALAGLIGWLIPLAIALLALSRWWQRHQGAPPLLRIAPSRSASAS